MSNKAKLLRLGRRIRVPPYSGESYKEHRVRPAPSRDPEANPFHLTSQDWEEVLLLQDPEKY